MDKKELKTIQIIDVKVNTLRSGQDFTGEYSTDCDVDFILSHPITFDIFEKTYVIDRIKMLDWYGDEIVLRYANAEMDFCCFPVPKIFIHKIYLRVIEEQKTGVLQGWSLEDRLMEMLQDGKIISSCY